jgi:hypothetical protein
MTFSMRRECEGVNPAFIETGDRPIFFARRHLSTVEAPIEEDRSRLVGSSFRF